ncbi:MAG TPA: hypothetical protein VFS12_01435, partial [Terriglobia bacterium]|nr:hypothetical protein [Terriglobia bacterium]
MSATQASQLVFAAVLMVWHGTNHQATEPRVFTGYSGFRADNFALPASTSTGKQGNPRLIWVDPS